MSAGSRWATSRTPLFVLTVAVQLVVLYWPRPVSTGTSLPVDKLVHAAVFGAVLWAGARAGVAVRPLAAVLAVHAGLSEVVQGTLLDRDGNVPDALADLTGLLLAGLALRRWPAAGDGPATPADRGAADRE
ncbi:hypothetical protein [Kineosporia sp. R_H_3]|uniref:hypothetical protein n=1 Tax=Kineosporia sp. R_H_3 TaxID=1961848 RepID=UPI000B4B2593|nr:hypothetical protein [Kineosporia sp. R_H_3]